MHNHQVNDVSYSFGTCVYKIFNTYNANLKKWLVDDLVHKSRYIFNLGRDHLKCWHLQSLIAMMFKMQIWSLKTFDWYRDNNVLDHYKTLHLRMRTGNLSSISLNQVSLSNLFIKIWLDKLFGIWQSKLRPVMIFYSLSEMSTTVITQVYCFFCVPVYLSSILYLYIETYQNIVRGISAQLNGLSKYRQTQSSASSSSCNVRTLWYLVYTRRNKNKQTRKHRI